MTVGPPIHHLALRTSDVDRLERFYADVVGLPVVRRDPGRGSVWLGAGSAVIMIERADPEEVRVAPGSRELVAFAAFDIARDRARLARAGVEVEAETDHTLYFRDPDGRRVGLSTYVLPPETGWTRSPS